MRYVSCNVEHGFLFHSRIFAILLDLLIYERVQLLHHVPNCFTVKRSENENVTISVRQKYGSGDREWFSKAKSSNMFMWLFKFNLLY